MEEFRFGLEVEYSPVAFQAGGLFHPGFWRGVVEGVRLPVRHNVSGTQPKMRSDDMTRYDMWDLIVNRKNGGVFGENVLRFMKVPTLEDFLEVCKILPWTSVWDKTLIPAVKKKGFKWPTPEPGHKANFVDVPGIDTELRIERVSIWRNKGGA